MITKINNVLFRLIKYFLAFAILAITCLLFFQIISRYILGFSYAQIDELGRHVFVWSICLGTALAFREKAHLGITALVDKFSGKLKFVTAIFLNLVMILFFLIILLAGIDLVKLGMRQITDALFLPLGYIYTCLPVGALLCITVYIENLYLLLRSNHSSKQLTL